MTENRRTQLQPVNLTQRCHFQQFFPGMLASILSINWLWPHASSILACLLYCNKDHLSITVTCDNIGLAGTRCLSITVYLPPESHDSFYNETSHFTCCRAGTVWYASRPGLMIVFAWFIIVRCNICTFHGDLLLDVTFKFCLLNFRCCLYVYQLCMYIRLSPSTAVST